MPTKRVQFTEWLPDQPDNAGGLNQALNVIPVSVGYQPFPNAEDFSGAASEDLNSVFVAKWDTEVVLFAGGASKIFKFNSATEALDDKSKSGGYTSTFPWRFTQFGKTVLACNGTAIIQYWTIGTSTLWADVATSPTAKHITVVRDFVVTGSLATGTLGRSTVRWSDINDETDWTAGTTSQSDLQVIADGGNLVGLTGGEFGLIFLEKSISRMSYVGSPLFFQFDNISRGLGCLSGNSICQYNQVSFFLSDDGFYSCDGNQVTPIGNEKVDRWFFSDCDLSLISSMTASINPAANIAIWNYANVGGGRSMLVYNWTLGKWARVETLATVLGNIATTGTTLEGLGTLGYTDIDAMPASLDARLWVGGKFMFAGATGTKISTFSGSTYNSELVTTDLEVGYNSVINLLRPQIDNGSADIAVASRRELDDSIIFGTTVSTSSEGRANVRTGGRYHRISVKPTGSWINAMAIDVDFKPQGNR